jgi:hypothetical protein
MTDRTLLFLLATVAMSWCFQSVPLFAQQPTRTRASTYEMTVTLRASEILQPGLLSHPLYRVRNDVVTDVGVNTFAVDTQLFGTFLVHSNTQLLERMVEIDAMKRIDDMKKSDVYGRAVGRAADRKSDAQNDAVVDYVSPIHQEPFSGIGKFFDRLSRDTEEDIDEDDVREYRAFQNQSAVVNETAKRDLCRQLGLNPYTTNLMLQRKLDDVSNAIAIGGFKMPPEEGKASTNLAAEIYMRQVTPEVSALVYGKSENALRVQNQAALEQMGATAKDVTALLSNPSFTPWLQAQFVTSLQALSGATGRATLIRDASRAITQEADGIFYADSARLLARLAAQKWQVARIEMKKGAPYCILRDGSVLVALQWDYACWSTSAEKLVTWLQALAVDGKKPPAITLAITGQATARLRQELEQRGLRLVDRQIKGPLN